MTEVLTRAQWEVDATVNFSGGDSRSCYRSENGGQGEPAGDGGKGVNSFCSVHFVKCQELTLRASHPFSSYGPRGHSVAINQGTADTQPPSATRDEIKKRDAAQRGGDAAFQHVLEFNAVCARVLISRIKSLKCAVFVYWNEAIKWSSYARPYLFWWKLLISCHSFISDNVFDYSWQTSLEC